MNIKIKILLFGIPAFLGAIVLVVAVYFFHYIKAQDLTPLVQPPWASDFWSDRTDAFYYPSPLAEIFTGNELLDATKELKHSFFVETKLQNIMTPYIQPVIVINGTEYQMQEQEGSSGEGLWVYHTDNMCSSDYNYYYRIRYNRRLLGYKTLMIGSADSPLHSEVAEFGSATWFATDGHRPSSNRVGEVTFRSESLTDDNPREKQIFIQRLIPGDNPHRISFVGLPHDETKFEIIERPPITQELACGDYAVVGVRWSPTSGDLHDDSMLLIKYQIYLDGRWQESAPAFQITLKGRPSLPPPP